ncbi:hypothetical protein DVH24_034673 [Malus domestica]|uniref:EF-hand domain-containing protein n=1 Tax=Malus domestica TaxID=3750 RepID=A0A498J1S3_MALDO|nr:hypothetical protein DVH24_034673 [Malus domestica]
MWPFCRMYDFDRNGTMSFEEFLALNKFLLKVKTVTMQMQLEFFVVQQAFSDRERGRGYLVTDDVNEALVKIGFLLDTPAFYTVCESFDQKKKGMFRLDDFISLCIFLQSARNLFNSFDTAKQGRVTLDLNQFVYCSERFPFSSSCFTVLGFLTSIFSSGRICRSLFELWLEG